MQKGFKDVNLHGCVSGSLAVPIIGENGNWYIGNDDTGVKAQGSDGAQGETGLQGPEGPAGTRGSQWYTGIGITGTNTSDTIFNGSGVASALAEDYYLNISTGNIYRCTVPGNEPEAKWVYTGNMKGSQAMQVSERDLTTIFSTEIADYSSAWAWIKARITADNLNDLYVGDYIPITVNNHIVKMQIAGINTYYKTLNPMLGRHIDFISIDCYPESVKWNTTNYNNGNAQTAFPYLASNLYSYLNTTLYGYLPQEVKNVITSKVTTLEQRYSGGGQLTESTSWGSTNIGKLWVPTEYEVFGSAIWGTLRWSAGQSIQYPIFKDSYRYIIKGIGNGGDRSCWWTACASSGYSTQVCYVDAFGQSYIYFASHDMYVPVCFRIDES